MSFSTATIQPNATVVAIDTRNLPKVVYLPTVSTNQGRLLILKDYYGTSGKSTITLSTTGTDLIEDINWTAAMTSSFMTMSMLSDGLRSWRITGLYGGTVITAPSSYVTTNLVYFLDAGNPSSYPGSGSTWTNLIGTGYNMTLYNSPTYVSANGGYLNFNPASSHYAESTTSLPLATRFSMEVWHYYTGTSLGTGAPCIVSEIWPGTTGQMNYLLSAYPAGFPSLQVNFYTGAWQSSAATSLVANNWYHIVGTYDGANLQLYINGSLSVTTANTATPSSSGGGFRLMRRWLEGEYWGGGLAIYRFYNRALTLAEVSQNYTGSRSRFGV